MTVFEIRYEPRLDSLDGFLSDTAADMILIVGTPPGDLFDALPQGTECRYIPEEQAALHLNFLRQGLYGLRHESGWQVVLVPGGQEPAAPRTERPRSLGDPADPLLVAEMSWRQWSTATPLAPNAFNRGDVVHVIGGGAIGRVEEVQQTPSGTTVAVSIEGSRQLFLETSLRPVEGDPHDPAFWIRQEPADAEQIARTLTFSKLEEKLTDVIYAFQTSKTIFRAYQFRPLLKILGSDRQRLLIADEVGLGKTIEAGLIWNELEQRHRLERILIVCPAGLVNKWRAEMDRRFDRQLPELTNEDFGRLIERLRKGEVDIPFSGVVSLDRLRKSPHLSALEEYHPYFDLTIVDEAHSMRNQGTASNDLGQLLQELSLTFLMLSATPLNLGQDDLFNLLHVLDPEQFDSRYQLSEMLAPSSVLIDVARDLRSVGEGSPRPIISTLDAALTSSSLGRAMGARREFIALRELLEREGPLPAQDKARARRYLHDLHPLASHLNRTRKVDVPGDKAVRSPITVDVRWTPQELGLYEAVWRGVLDYATAHELNPKFIGQMPLRQAASSIPAMIRVLGLTGGERQITVRESDLLDDLAVDPDSPILDSVSPSGMYGHVRDVVAQLELPTVDTKFEAFVEALRRARTRGTEQIMVFSFFKRTLEYLAERLRQEFSLRVMHGDIDMDRRETIMEEFRRGDFSVLLLSEVGAEGLDFEFCNILVNYDLPWNPMRVEQRIGRLDRFGQEHEKIFIINLRVPGTIESDIFERLYDRIHVFEQSIGELEPILRETTQHMADLVFDPSLSKAERAQRTDEIAVAIEDGKRDLTELRENAGVLAGLEGLDVEGFDDDSPGEGRYIGTGEIEALVRWAVDRNGGQLRPDRRTKHVHLLSGDKHLAQFMRTAIPLDKSGGHARRLAWQIQEGGSARITFDSAVASRTDIPLISIRHPLVEAALQSLREEPLTLRRFGTVGIPGLGEDQSYLVIVHRATTSGLRPRLELWTVAVDLRSGSIEPHIGNRLLEELARGALRDAPAVDDDISLAFSRATSHLNATLMEEQRSRRQENEAMIDSQIEVRTLSLERRVRRLEREIVEAGDLRRRLISGQVRKAQALMSQIAHDLEAKRQLNVSIQPLAAVVVRGTPQDS